MGYYSLFFQNHFRVVCFTKAFVSLAKLCTVLVHFPHFKLFLVQKPSIRVFAKNNYAADGLSACISYAAKLIINGSKNWYVSLVKTS